MNAKKGKPIKIKSALVSWTQIANATGYKLFWGTRSRVYGYSQDVGNQTNYRVGNLIGGTTYYFSAKSYNATDLTGFGNEATFRP